MNKKGSGSETFWTIVGITLAVIVLIVLTVFFGDNFSNLSAQTKDNIVDPAKEGIEDSSYALKNLFGGFSGKILEEFDSKLDSFSCTDKTTVEEARENLGYLNKLGETLEHIKDKTEREKRTIALQSAIDSCNKIITPASAQPRTKRTPSTNQVQDEEETT